LHPTGFTIGVADLPSRRTRDAVEWDPAAGPLVITGPPRSGRSSALRAIGAIAEARGLTVIWVPAAAREAVRSLAIALDTPHAVVLLDDAGRTLAAATTADQEAPELLAAVVQRLPAALVAPPSWAHHRLCASAGLTAVLCGLAAAEETAWEVPAELRGLRAAPGRAVVMRTNGWAEAQLCLPQPWEHARVVATLPAEVTAALPKGAIGIGGDRATAIVLPPGQAVVIGPPCAEREAITTAVAAATGASPIVLESGFQLGLPGTPTPRVIVCVRPTARAVREIVRNPPRGLVDAAPPPLRAVVVIDGVASAVQVSGV
jgi:S-DNA-T family DNA segregation ATPase FtsK/SpoIIIE